MCYIISSTLLFIRSIFYIYSSLHLLIPNSQSIPSPQPPLIQMTLWILVRVSLPFLQDKLPTFSVTISKGINTRQSPPSLPSTHFNEERKKGKKTFLTNVNKETFGDTDKRIKCLLIISTVSCMYLKITYYIKYWEILLPPFQHLIK